MILSVFFICVISFPQRRIGKKLKYVTMLTIFKSSKSISVYVRIIRVFLILGNIYCSYLVPFIFNLLVIMMSYYSILWLKRLNKPIFFKFRYLYSNICPYLVRWVHLLLFFKFRLLTDLQYEVSRPYSSYGWRKNR